jgi:hypothetical protein
MLSFIRELQQNLEHNDQHNSNDFFLKPNNLIEKKYFTENVQWIFFQLRKLIRVEIV